jgi:CubicO group peptidase (beta-lactamase class C family)
MIRSTVVAAATLLLANPAAAQSQQERLDTRYDRALAAGYKALMLCGALAQGTRTAESVEAWELNGIQAPLDGLLADLPPAEISYVDGTAGGPLPVIRTVAVRFADDMPPRIAAHTPGKGCAILPVGMVAAPPLPKPTPLTGREVFRVAIPEFDFPANALGEMGFSASYGEGARTTGVVIAKDGELIGEAYADGFDRYTPQRTWSVAKSLAATMIGAAVQRGEADVNASAGLGISAADPRRAITIDHLLRMASGRYSDTPGNRTDPLYYGGATVTEVALDWPLIAQPGSTYRYANNDTLAAVAAIRPTFAAHPPSALFGALGMARTVAETDWQGNYILSSQVWTTARDLARFGQLYLDDGMANGKRILPEGWVKYVSTPSGPQPDGPFGYGAGFWLMNKSEGVPPDTFAAFGNRGQYVVIVPSRNVVIVRRGEDPAGSRFDIAAFTRDVLAALE